MSALNQKEGVFILLEPITNTAGHLSQFKVYLANRTSHDYSFSCAYYRAGQQVFDISQKQVNSKELFYLAAISLDELNGQGSTRNDMLHTAICQ